MSKRKPLQHTTGSPVASPHLNISGIFHNLSENELELSPRQIRLEDIQRRLRALEFGEEYSSEAFLSEHPEVNVCRVLTEEEWIRIEIGLLEYIEHASNRRRQRHERRLEKLVQVLGSTTVQRLPVRAQAFAPAAETVVHYRSGALIPTLTDGRIEEAVFKKRLPAAIDDCLPMLTPWLNRRIGRLALSIPPAWAPEHDRWTPSKSRARELAHSVDAYDRGAAVYDLACYVFRCHGASTAPGPHSVWHFGLDSLACKSCSIKDPETDALTDLCVLLPDETGHEMVKKLLNDAVLPNLERLQRNEDSQISPAFLDGLGITFFCESCTWAAVGWEVANGGPLHSAVASEAMDWRATLEHIRATCQKVGYNYCEIRCATELERQYISTCVKHEQALSIKQDVDDRHWGCCHCTGPDLDSENQGGQPLYNAEYIRPWYTLEEVEQHIREVHGLQTPKEGSDYLWDRSVRRKGWTMKDVPFEHQIENCEETANGRAILWSEIRSMEAEILESVNET